MTAPALSCPDAETALGALVLGALEPSEREQVEAHVRVCRACSEALADIAPLPGLLHRVDLTPADLEPAPPAVLERALAQVRREEAQAAAAADVDRPVADVVPLLRRWLPLLAAAAVVLALLVGVTTWANHRTPASVTASASSTTSGVKASVVLTPTQEGTAMDLTLSGVKAGEHCELVAVSSDGQREVAATWVANYEGEADVSGTTGLTTAQIDRLDITTPDGRTLLTIDVPA